MNEIFFEEVVDIINNIVSFEAVFELVTLKIEEYYEISNVSFLYHNNLNKKLLQEKPIDGIFGEKITVFDNSNSDISEYLNNLGEGITAYPVMLEEQLIGHILSEKEHEIFRIIAKLLKIVFQRIALAGHIMDLGEGEKFEIQYLKEILNNEIKKYRNSDKIVCLAILKIENYIDHKMSERISPGLTVLNKIIAEIVKQEGLQEIIQKFSDDKIVLIFIKKAKEEIIAGIERIKMMLEDNNFNRHDEIRGIIKIRPGYAFYPKEAATPDKLISYANEMIRDNIKMEGWLNLI